MTKTKVGKISHYYDKITVAIINIDKTLKIGDKVKFVKKGKDLFEQEVGSIEFDHKKITSAKKGVSVGVKVVQPVKVGTEVFKVT